MGHDRRGQTRHVVLEPPELLAVWADQRQFSPLADVTLFLGLTGLRWGEFVALRPCDLLTTATGGPMIQITRSIVRDLGEGRATVKSTKTGTERLVPVTQLAAELAARWAQGKDREALLAPGPDGPPVRRAPLVRHEPAHPRRGHPRRSGHSRPRKPRDHTALLRAPHRHRAPPRGHGPLRGAPAARGQVPGGASGATQPPSRTPRAQRKTEIPSNSNEFGFGPPRGTVAIAPPHPGPTHYEPFGIPQSSRSYSCILLLTQACPAIHGPCSGSYPGHLVDLLKAVHVYLDRAPDQARIGTGFVSGHEP